MSETYMGKRRMWPTPQAYNERGSRAAYVAAGKGGMDLVTAVQLPNPVPPASPQLTLFAEAFPANPTASRGSAAVALMSATSGASSPESFAKLSPDGCWRKMCRGFYQPNLDGSLDEYCETWPRAGMTRSGTAYLRVPLVPLTGEIESGLWPTPQTFDASNGNTPETWYFRQQRNPNMSGSSRPTALSIQVQMWPTPDTHQGGRTLHNVEYRGRSAYAANGVKRTILLENAAKLWPTPTAMTDTGGAAMCKWGGSGARAKLRTMTTSHELNGALNPTWVEWLMGYPLGWTVCADWGTASSRKSRNGSAAASSTPTRVNAR